ncbi:Holliday junction branch migration protein RuvA [Lysinibacter sp. HNR]|uniref:Holliday junction branch migration protein RuvA n=1 Tax=Lysinibacter sp. HNR TaxID=3031408 RepID=UPI002434AA0F|nr:Holliday junction branch migration protein RuvA [Lysinibacter sp. HNR]WGD36308.1 Holliday junction branch migration protein RuvA [Lysinibacter sp. HNR]
MISSLRGPVLDVRDGTVVIDVGGVGFAVEVTSAEAAKSHRGNEVFLHTNLVVRDDALTLFGFATRDELEVFIILLGVSGVGPRSALGVLGVLSPQQIAAAVAAEDDKPFRQVSGIGPKTAKLLTVSLSGKLTALGFSPDQSVAPTTTIPGIDKIEAALVNLGWSEREAADAIARVHGTSTNKMSEAQLLRAALAALGENRTKR